MMQSHCFFKEERMRKKKVKSLFDNDILNEAEIGTFASLQIIHKYLSLLSNLRKKLFCLLCSD